MGKDRIDTVAEAICDLTYSEMMEVARMLNDMHGDVPRTLDTDEGWADILHSWAEAQVSP